MILFGSSGILPGTNKNFFGPGKNPEAMNFEIAQSVAPESPPSEVSGPYLVKKRSFGPDPRLHFVVWVTRIE